MLMAPNSLGTPSSEIYTPHFNGPATIGPTVIEPTKTFSRRNEFGVPTKQLFTVSYGWKGYNTSNPITGRDFSWNANSAENFDLGYTPVTIKGKDYAVISTVNRNFAVPVSSIEKNGWIHNTDDTDRNMAWFNSIEIPHASEYTATPRFQEMVESKEVPQHDWGVDKHVHKTVSYHGPINEFGKRLSQVDSLRVARMYFREGVGERRGAGRDLAAELDGFDTYALIGDSNTLYAVGELNDGRSVFIRSTNTMRNIEREAEHYGVSFYDYLSQVLTEEALHMKRDSVGRIRAGKGTIAEELDTKGEKLDHYRGLLSNPKLSARERQTLERMVDAIEDDIRTTPARYSGLKNISNYESVISEYRTEAREAGLEGAEIDDYVASKLETAANDAEYGDEGGSIDTIVSSEAMDGDAAEASDEAPAEDGAEPGAAEAGGE